MIMIYQRAPSFNPLSKDLRLHALDMEFDVGSYDG